jgi:GNAT superfamily N-acetyltransferase
MTATMVKPLVRVRDARADDNASLLELAAACPMEGDIALAISREPDFFALNRLEGAQWRAGVADVDWGIAGCVMCAARTAYLHGEPRLTLYAGDLKVHPALRGVGVADALTEWTIAALHDLGAPDIPTLVTVLGGNRAMERRIGGRGGAAALTRFATVRAFSIPLLWPRSARTQGVSHVSPATISDVDEMASLWRQVAPGRQFAPVFDAAELDAWITRAPGLAIDDYRVARSRDGRIIGFMAWWDQADFKQSRVLRYSPRLAVVRAAINAVAALTRGVRLPSIGEPLRYRTALHVCVPAGRPDVLRALVRASCAELRAQRYAVATIGLDVHDPLCLAMAGLAAQPTDVNAYVFTPGGPYVGPSLADRPLHCEISLV